MGASVTAIGVTLSAVGCTSDSGAKQDSDFTAVRTVGPWALGVNTAAWDGEYTAINAVTVDNELRTAGLRLLRYPGGSWADEYDWSANTDTSKCNGLAASGCLARDPLGFDTFSAQARAASASSFVTVNYGSASPAQAAEWVGHARTTNGDAVALWEVGNESYSCTEANYHLAQKPTFVKGYEADGPSCPTTAIMAASYTANSPSYIQAMIHADPSARIGVPWALTARQAAGAGVSDAARWNDAVLGADGGNISFVDAHWYPFDSVSGLTDSQILDSIQQIPATAATIRSTLKRHKSNAAIVVGEANISNQPTTLDFQPVSALFAAAASLEWLSQGAQNVDWWDMNNFGSPARGDYGLLSSGPPEKEPADTPLPPYYGEELASMLTAAGAHLRALVTGKSNLLGFQSDFNGLRRVLLVNTDATQPVTVTPNWFQPESKIDTATYSSSTAATPAPIVHTSSSATTALSLPGESIVVLSGTAVP